MAAVPFTEEDLHELYMWVDEIPVSRPKRNIARDFADGCCIAEIVKFFFPRIVHLHNYTPSMSMSKKRENWRTLNAKVFRKLYFEVPPQEVEDITGAVPGAIERFLRALRIKISQIKQERVERAAIVDNSNAGGGGAGYGYVNAQEFDAPMDRYYNEMGNGGGSGGAAPAAGGGGGGGRPPSSSSSPAMRGSGSAGGNAHSYAPGYHHPSALPSSSSSPQQHHHHQQQQLLLEEKERTILELRETVGILSEKIMKLEELVKVKDVKLNQYRAKFGKT